MLNTWIVRKKSFCCNSLQNHRRQHSSRNPASGLDAYQDIARIDVKYKWASRYHHHYRKSSAQTLSLTLTPPGDVRTLHPIKETNMLIRGDQTRHLYFLFWFFLPCLETWITPTSPTQLHKLSPAITALKRDGRPSPLAGFGVYNGLKQLSPPVAPSVSLMLFKPRAPFR